MVAVGVDALVGGADRPLDPDQAQERHRLREQRPDAAREERDREHDRRDHEGALDPEVGADRVVADREHEADGGQGERGRTAERPLEQHRAGDVAAAAGVAAGGLVDPHRVAADRGRQQLPGRVGDEVGARQPGEPLVDPAHVEQLLPAPGHRPDRADHDRDRREEVADLRVREQVQRRRERSIFQTRYAVQRPVTASVPASRRYRFLTLLVRRLAHRPCRSVRTRLRRTAREPRRARARARRSRAAGGRARPRGR